LQIGVKKPEKGLNVYSMRLVSAERAEVGKERQDMNPRVSRRTFLSNALLGGAGFFILRNSRLAYSYESNEKLNIALIGVGGRGSWFVDAIPNLGQNIVAMCDVNDRKAELSFKGILQAKKFHDFRRMLDEMNKEIDAVVIATPDHTHAVAAAAAMRAGKGVYCEKPPQSEGAINVIKYAIEEARALEHNYIGSEHILLGLLRETDGNAAKVLTNLGVKPEDVRKKTRETRHKT
jgi:D-arabinose 1-dehydrogenase-like Zn-dependent alcohol dehydrogenase